MKTMVWAAFLFRAEIWAERKSDRNRQYMKCGAGEKWLESWSVLDRTPTNKSVMGN